VFYILGTLELKVQSLTHFQTIFWPISVLSVPSVEYSSSATGGSLLH
jgi:hypothetical protein